MSIAYFDFDGTLISCETFFRFMLFAVGFRRCFFKLPQLAVIFTLFRLKIISNTRAKILTLSLLIKGMNEEELELKAREFAMQHLDRHINPDVYARLEYHLEHKHHVVLVSANLAIFLKYWVMQHKLDAVLATEIECIDGQYTGKLKTANCYGDEKVNRIKGYLADNNLQFAYSFGYGNSAGDYALLKYVDEGHLV